MIMLPTSDIEGMAVAEFDTRTLLKHAAEQARARHYEKYFIVDVDSHHYESSAMREIVKYIDEPAIRHMAAAAAVGGAKGGVVLPSAIGYQDMNGRVTRYPLRNSEKTPPDQERDVELTRRWMDAMGIDVALLFPTPMLQLSFHPLVEMQVAMAKAYNRWLVEKVLAAESRIKTLLYLPLHDPDACLEIVNDMGDLPGVSGVRRDRDARYSGAFEPPDEGLCGAGGAQPAARIPRALELARRRIQADEPLHFGARPGLRLLQHGSPDQLGHQRHGQRFPKLKVIWMESGLAWLPFMMQRLDNEYRMRTSEAPLLKKMPSDYMRDMYYSTQPMEMTDMTALKDTFRQINAETQLMYSSDYPHWDFDLPSTVYDIPFLSEQARKNILGETAARVFNLEIPKEKLANIPAAS